MNGIYDPAADVTHFREYWDVAKRLQNLLTQLWSDWAAASQVPAPRLCLQVRDVADAFYDRRPEEHTIYLFLVESDIEDVQDEIQREAVGGTRPGRRRGVPWALVTGQLLHELMHAFQYRVLEAPEAASEAGRNLLETTKARFAGAGHDELFYTAIAMHAAYFGLTPEEFAREL